MLGAIDQLARIVGYCTIAYGLILLLGRLASDRDAMKGAQADRDHLKWLKEHNPNRYEREIWLRDNLQRAKAGLPTDPGYAEYVQNMVASLPREVVRDIDRA